MNNLVFLEPDDLNEIPFTTSKVIAEHGRVQHETVVRLISKYENDLKEFGILRFEIGEIKGRGQPEKVYHLNEQQATLLITYMKNTLPVRQFKKALVRQFYIMQKELISRKVTRQIGKQAREALTNAIQGLPESPHKQMKYKHYTDLVYKIVFGKNTKQLREFHGISKTDNLRNRFTSAELGRVEKLEGQVSSLIDLDYDYQSIKDIVSRKYLKSA
ncbi:MAG TPA: Rha family transcriptional regulator [Desulfosporosinus sp.]|nr:Rha family transcriptional regulator [Desulfosporosinus sp.]